MAEEEDDGIDELLALMDADEENQDPNPADSSALEEEYLQLQRKMKELEEKIKKKENSPKNSRNEQKITKNAEKSAKSDPKSKNAPTKILETSKNGESNPKSSFLAAFADAPFSLPKIEPENVEKKSKMDKFADSSKRFSESNNSENVLPPQKRRRIANPSQDGSATMSTNRPHALTESLRNGNLKQGAGNVSNSAREGVKKVGCKPNEPVVVGTEQYSRIRLKKCFVPNGEMSARMQGKRFLKLSLLRSTMKISEETDWVTVGVIAKQLDRQTTKNGKQFSIWTLTDLDDCTKTVTFFLFGAVHEKLSQNYAVGSVVGVLNPTIMPPKKDETQKSFDDSPALTVDVPERVMNIGLSADLGWCLATKWRNKQPAGKCLAVINKQYTDVCVFHMKTKYKKASSKRSDLQGSAAAPLAAKYKNTLWNNVKNDQFFYGGKVYSASPSSGGGNAKKPSEPKVKLTKFLSDNGDIATDAKKELLERSKVMKALSGIDGNHSLSGCSQTFAEMLSSGDNIAGSRQYLNHLNNSVKKVEEAKKASLKPQSPAELLKEQANLIKSRKLGQKSDVPIPKSNSLLQKVRESASISQKATTQYVSPGDIKKMTADMVKAKRLAIAKNSPKLGSVGPKLGQGLSTNDLEIDLDWGMGKNSASNSELAKKKAIAKLRSDSGDVKIRKTDPNRGVLNRIENVRKSENMKSEILKKVAKNREDLVKNVENIPEENLPPKKSLFGKMSEEQFNKILNTKSAFSNEIDDSEIEEHEKYFNPLIRKEMTEKKLSETFEVTCKIVTCAQCKYTFWSPHDRCKELRHNLNWKTAKKKFFQCSSCKHRTTTWETYPPKSCFECGSEKNWQRTSMLNEKDKKILESETLLIRGLEHGMFLNSLK